MQDRVPEDEVEALIGEGEALGVGCHGLDFETLLGGGGLQRRQHPRRDVSRGRALDHTQPQEVDREVTGAGADLQRVAEVQPSPPAECLSQLAQHLALAGRPEIDSPFGVV
jgi:hypothetical protein